ncbi:MAG: hypothetical protein IT236_12660 [Bacteroidia bacterium]|nr:hypothetical protein [Bacteroidia bacterium]
MRASLLIFILFFCALSCNRKNKDTKCTLTIIPFADYIDAYNFKEGSNWTFKLKDSGKTGAIHYQSSFASSIPIKTYGKGATPCDSFTRYPFTELTLRNNLVQGQTEFLSYYLTDGYICLNKISDRSERMVIYGWLFEQTDTIRYSNSFPITKFYQEKIIDTVTILNKLYKDVHQVYYYPGYSGFKRVWWCPGVGFVKLERIIPTSNQTEIWELQSHNAVL